MRITLAGFLILICFMALIIIDTGTHGNITMENKETAIIVYGSIALGLAAAFNLIVLGKSIMAIKTYLSLTFNSIGVIILLSILVYILSSLFEGDEFPIFLFIINGIAIALSLIIIKNDLNFLKENKK